MKSEPEDLELLRGGSAASVARSGSQPREARQMMSSVFATTDPDLAAYLYACAYRPLKVNHAEGRPAFTFPAEAALSAEAFYAGAAIPAKNLLYAVHRLEFIRRTKQYEYIAA